MFCTNCGCELQENMSQCLNCGKTVLKSNMNSNYVPNGTLIVERTRSLVGAIIPMVIYLDGNEVAFINVGQKFQFNLPFGVHNFTVKLVERTEQVNIQLTPERKMCYILVTAKSTKPGIKDVKYC